MIYVVEAKSLTSAIPLVKTTSMLNATKAKKCIKQMLPESVIGIMTSPIDRDDVPFAEEYSLE